MKHFLTLLLLLTSLQFSAFSQKKNVANLAPVVKVPDNVNSSFKSLYSGAADSKWSKNYSGNYVANFMNNESLRQSVEFTASGAMVKSKIDYLPDGIPAPVVSAVNAHAVGAKVLEVSKMQMPGVAPYYKVRVTTSENITKELLVSEEGTITE